MDYNSPGIRQQAKEALIKEGKEKPSPRSISIRAKKMLKLGGKGATVVDNIAQPETNIDIDKAFELLPIYIEMVVKGFCNGAYLCGEGGIGKSFNVDRAVERLEKEVQEEDPEFKITRVSGTTSPGEMYNFIYEHRTGVLVFDDCDEAYKTARGKDILKTVLDTREQRIVHWMSGSGLIRAPRSFEFTGRIIFVTNQPLAKADETLRALITRIYYLDFTFPKEQKLKRIFTILPAAYKDTTLELRTEVAEYIRDNIQAYPDINIRTFIKILDMSRFSPDGWRQLALNVR
ncbi:MAG TPA: hypothetical protein ENI23_11065 [bacterium]|nr:hypothetical protein [bacterium]